MRVFTYSEARQNLSKLLALAQREEVEIRRKDGSTFSLRAKRKESKSPFDVPGVSTGVTTSNILEALRESRER
ncbi:prevent-host-death protein [Halorhodospira abdelmalekii]|nr:prevent-host-death protein [Halorhodospira abdelmalekii]